MMNAETIYREYGIKIDGVNNMRDNIETFTSQGFNYYVFKTTESELDEWNERYQMASHMHANGEPGILLPILTREQSLTVEEHKAHNIVLVEASPSQGIERLGRKLAAFHYRGRSVQAKIESCSRIGKWKELWERRSDQMEKVWREKLLSGPQNDFEKTFVDVFPYYAGLTENAIQYLVDTEVDDNPGQVDVGTVCHERFGEKTWLTPINGKHPVHWVFDHGARDVAEWIREYYFQQPNTYHYRVQSFLRDYQGNIPFTPFSIRLLFSRLLLPVHFFETVEMYYISPSEEKKAVLEERLNNFNKHTDLYEEMLSEFFEVAEVPTTRMKIPTLPWLSK